MRYYLTIVLLLIAGAIRAEATTVSVTEFGAEPNSRKDCLAAVRKALESCKDKESAVLLFPKGRYDFFAPEGWNRFALPVGGFKNLTIDGQGSEFVFHGIMGVASVQHSENVTLKDFTVDWDRPMIAQGTIEDTRDDRIDVRFDEKAYPFEIVEEKIFFLGEGWRKPVDGYTLLFDAERKELLPQTRDNALGGNELFNTKAEHLGDGLVRFHGKPKMKPKPGTLIALWLGRYVHVTFDLRQSKDVILENISVFHSLSHCVSAFKTENITLRRVRIKANEEKDRVFSIVADGFHLNTCRGKINIEECEHYGAGDDFLNVHGMNVMVQKRVDDHTVEVGVSGKTGASYVLGVGDDVWFIDGKTVQRGETGRIKEIKEIKDGSKILAKHVVFERPIPEAVKENDALENKTWNAELRVFACKIGRSHRARGILVTTPKKVVIESNEFRTAGAAILIEGDVNYWYESGAVDDVEIIANHFVDCFSSGYGGDWGHAVITIHPSFKPQSDVDEAFHRNIRIQGNNFFVFDVPVLFARSVRGLKFVDNLVKKTETYKPFAAHRVSFWLDGCRDVTIRDNHWEDDVPGKNVKMFHMKPGDINIGDAELKSE